MANIAERLLAIAQHIKHRAGIVPVETLGDEAIDEAALCRVKLALRLRGRSVLALKAVMEDWDLQEIVRELH